MRKTTRSGQLAVEQITLEDGAQRLTMLNLGACTQDWRIHSNGQEIPIVLGYENPLSYFQNPCWLGAIAGPVANRISDGGFTLGAQHYPLNAGADGVVLHSGDADLSKRIFTVEPDQSRNAVRFEYMAAHGEGGFPANVRFVFDIMLRDGTLTYDMRALPDRPTPIALAQHNYYNLMGGGQIWNHHLRLEADHYTPLLETGLPDGRTEPVGRRMDFQTGSVIADKDPNRHGYDDNFVLPAPRDFTEPAVTMKAQNGLRLDLWTDQPAVQFYTGTHLCVEKQETDAAVFGPFSGLCLEPQIHPNAVNTPEFPSPIVTPEQPYHQRLAIKLSDC